MSERTGFSHPTDRLVPPAKAASADTDSGRVGSAHSPSPVMSIEVEIERIMRTGMIWLAAEMIAAAALLGPAVAAGWRPADLPALAAIPWWIGAIVAGVGAAALLWAGCPVPAFTLEEAHAQKVLCIRAGSVMSLAGMALAGITVLLTPAIGG